MHQGTQSHFSSVIIEYEDNTIRKDIDKGGKKGDKTNVKIWGNLLAHLKLQKCFFK
jgi:hypothetical protein